MATSKTHSHRSTAGVSRRELLRAGSLLVPGLVVAPGFLLPAARAQSASSYDYYIAPTGADGNPGTQSSPWAITAINSKQAQYAGRRVGLLDGTYNVGPMMTQNRDVPALRINGGSASSPTVIAAVHRGAAVISANDGAYGGGNNSCAVLGHKSTAPQQGYITIDGLKFTGGSYQIIEIGNYDFTGPVVPGVLIQNCEFTDNNCSATQIAIGGNCAQITLNRTSGTILRNNYHHDNVGALGLNSADHFSALYQWQSSGTVVEYCTLINSGNFHGKEGGNQGTTIRNCYIDVSSFTSGQNRSGIQGFDGAPTSGMTQPSSFHNNIIVYNYLALDLQAELNNGGWSTPLAIYNNTIVAASSWTAGLIYYEQTAGARLLRFYNNLFLDSGIAPTSYGYTLANIDAFTLTDYNIYGGHAAWSTVKGGQWNSTSATGYPSFAAWQSSLSGSTGADAHSQNAVVAVVGIGLNALKYQLTTGIALGAGRVGGVAAGAAVNVGAWDGVVTQIGSGTLVVPNSPVLNVS